MLLDVKAARRRSRRRMILYSLPVVLLGLFVAWKLLSMPILAERAIDAYDREQFERSAETSDALMFLNVAEDWIPYFNRGTAYAAGEAYSQATDDLAKALERAPEDRRCDVTVNLALAWELQGDSYFSAGYFVGAAKLYETARAVLEAGAAEGCFEPPPPPEESQQEEEGDTPPPDEQDEQGDTPPPDQQDKGAGDSAEEKLEQADERIREKLDQSLEQGEQQQEREGTEETAPGDDEPEAGSKVDELGNKGDQAEEEKQNQDSTKRGQENNRDYVEKPW
ncbi:tetratricopeptide (TPR) repeat protein [Mycetocola sp. CAN_C7]|uniref:hypothetical protein n=1 Tax=Mycetocola sp. CAN_C7 TaxID=2787724 RepID=UPI0018CA3EED